MQPEPSLALYHIICPGPGALKTAFLGLEAARLRAVAIERRSSARLGPQGTMCATRVASPLARGGETPPRLPMIKDRRPSQVRRVEAASEKSAKWARAE